MGLFFDVSDEEILEIKNDIFVNSGIPALNRNQFSQSPFSTGWFGKDNTGSYSYEMCRISKHSHLEIINTEINKGDRWIQIFLSSFKLVPEITSIDQLKGVDGLKFHLPPNRQKRMRIRFSEIDGFSFFMTEKHKLKSFSSKSDLEKKVTSLRNLIKQDCENINKFFGKWYDLHEVHTTDWEGNTSI